MPRAKSVVLTKAEKAALTTKVKADIKAANESLKGVETSIKAANKVHAEATKTRDTTLKSLDKAKAGHQKTLDGLKAQLASLVAPVVAPGTPMA